MLLPGPSRTAVRGQLRSCNKDVTVWRPRSAGACPVPGLAARDAAGLSAGASFLYCAARLLAP